MTLDTAPASTPADEHAHQPDQSELDRQMAELVAQMQGELEMAPEPGTLHRGDVLHKGDADMPTPIMAHTVTSRGYCTIWDTLTAEPSLTSLNMLPAQLRKKRDDGSFVFTPRKPARTPVRGTFKCMLHPDDPNRAKWDAQAFPMCRKSNLLSEFGVEEHMEARHKRQWDAIKRAREKEREDQRWALEQAILKQAAQGVAATESAGRKR